MIVREGFVKVNMYANLRCELPPLDMRFPRYSPYWKRPDGWTSDDHEADKFAVSMHEKRRALAASDYMFRSCPEEK